MTGPLVLVGALALTVLVVLVLRRRDGRFAAAAAPGGTAAPGPSAGERPAGEVLTADDLGVPLGERATLVQLSSAFCSPCRATRTLLTDLVGRLDDVAYVDLDAESNLELVRRLDVLRTPTVLVLDPRGVVVRRASGVPRRDQVLAALAAV